MVHKTNLRTASPNSESSQAADEEVYGTLGAILGTLEVVATDELEPLSARQAQRLESALRLCDALQHQIEALLTIAADDLGARLRRARCTLRPLLEHAVQGARRCFEQHAVELRMPSARGWGEQRVSIDSSRVDRMLRVLTETLARGVGRGGRLELSLAQRGALVAIELTGARASDVPPEQAFASSLLARAAQRLFEAHGGSCRLDTQRLRLSISIPVAEEP